MNWSLFLTKDAIQFNLTPENEHEKELSAILKKYNGRVSVYDGIDVNMTKGDYLRGFGEKSDTLAITIHKLSTMSSAA